MADGLVLRVYGDPIPQGSKVANRFGGGVRDSNATKLTPWRAKVRDAAADAARYHDQMIGPVFVRITFTLTRPKVHYRTGRFAHLLRDEAPVFPIARGSGDLDKLIRSCLDSLTDARVWVDDCQVVDMRPRKVWAGEHELALDRAGARIEVVPLVEQEVLV